MIKRIWVFLLCTVFVVMLFDNLFAQDPPRRRMGRGFGWTGPEIGTVVSDFERKTYDGKDFKLSDQRGKILVLEMGACT